LGRAWRETDVLDDSFEAVITDLLDGEYTNPICVIAFNTTNGSSHDISEVVVVEVRAHAANIGDMSCRSRCSSSWSVTRAQRRKPALPKATNQGSLTL
jgi:hypothetical protein